MGDTDFSPRLATLRYAAQGLEGASDSARAQLSGLNAIAFGLLYVGDQLEEIRRELWNARNARGGVQHGSAGD